MREATSASRAWLQRVLLASYIDVLIAYSSRVACSRPLTVGTSFGSSMNGLAQQSTSRTVSLSLSDGTALACGRGTVAPSAALRAQMSSSSGQYIMEVAGGATFAGGECGGTRVRSCCCRRVVGLVVQDAGASLLQ